jgi:hypothetical protein
MKTIDIQWDMAIKFSKSPGYTPGSVIDIKKNSTLGGSIVVGGTAPAPPPPPPPPPASNPLCPSDTRDATLLSLASLPTVVNTTLDSTYDSVNRGSEYNAKYLVFTLDPSQAGTYQFDMSAGFDTYLYLNEGPCSNAFVGLLDSDDDGGPGTDSRITWVYNGIADFTGSLECTSYSGGATGAFSMTVTYLPPASDVFINGVVVNNGDAFQRSSEAVLPLQMTTTSEMDTSYSVSDGESIVASGNMPVDLRILPVGASYTVTAAGTVTFTLTMTALPDISGITNKILHLDASDASTLTLSGFDVTSWADKSVAGNNATPVLVAPGGFYPIYSPLNVAVEFNALNLTGMQTNAFLGTTPASAKTIFFVGSNLVETTPECFWTYGSGEGDVLSRYLSGTSPMLLKPGFGGLIVYDASIPTRSEPPVLNVYRNTPGTNPQTLRMYDESGFGDVTDVNFSITSGTYGLHLMRPLPSATINAGIHQTGNIHEVLAYNAALTDLDVFLIIQYLKLKWTIV